MANLEMDFFKTRLTGILENADRSDLASDLLSEIHLGHAGDEVDLASLHRDQNMLMRLGKRQHSYLRKVKEALERIDTGNFGICEECGNPIETSRLKARPTATLCIHCKDEQERNENQTWNSKKAPTTLVTENLF